MPDLKPGWTRWYCQRCERPLQHDAVFHDTVSQKRGGDGFTHDQCGGAVLPSMRDVKA